MKFFDTKDFTADQPWGALDIDAGAVVAAHHTFAPDGQLRTSRDAHRGAFQPQSAHLP